MQMLAIAPIERRQEALKLKSSASVIRDRHQSHNQPTNHSSVHTYMHTYQHHIDVFINVNPDTALLSSLDIDTQENNISREESSSLMNRLKIHARIVCVLCINNMLCEAEARQIRR